MLKYVITGAVLSAAFLWSYASDDRIISFIEKDLTTQLNSVAPKTPNDFFDYIVAGRDVIVQIREFGREDEIDSLQQKIASVGGVDNIFVVGSVANPATASAIAALSRSGGNKLFVEMAVAEAAAAAAAAEAEAVAAAEAEAAAAAEAKAAEVEAAVQCNLQLKVALAGSTVSFKPDSDQLNPKSIQLLDQISKTVELCTNNVLAVGGHTDSLGTSNFNLQLSQRRANAVKSRLVLNGVDASAIEAVGFGESSPIASNETEKGRAENRRIEFIFLPTQVRAPSATELSPEQR